MLLTFCNLASSSVVYTFDSSYWRKVRKGHPDNGFFNLASSSVVYTFESSYWRKVRKGHPDNGCRSNHTNEGPVQSNSCTSEASVKLGMILQAREWYREDLVGQAIADSMLPREALFLTSKLHPRDLAQAGTPPIKAMLPSINSDSAPFPHPPALQ